MRFSISSILRPADAAARSYALESRRTSSDASTKLFPASPIRPASIAQFKDATVICLAYSAIWLISAQIFSVSPFRPFRISCKTESGAASCLISSAIWSVCCFCLAVVSCSFFLSCSSSSNCSLITAISFASCSATFTLSPVSSRVS